MAKAIRAKHHDGDFFQGAKNRYYFRPGWKSLNTSSPDCQGLIAVRGYHTKIKPGAGAVLLNVNTVTNVFYRPDLISQYMGKFTSDFDDQKRKWPSVRAHLTGLRVSIEFERKYANEDQDIDSPGRRTKTLAGFGNFPDHEIVEETQTTVWDHLNSKYPEACLSTDKKLRSGNVGKATSPKKCYLASQLRVRSDQMYRKNPMPPEVTEQLIDAARRTPEENVNAILGEGLNALLAQNNAMPPILKSLGVSVVPQMLSVPARWARGPKIQFYGDKYSDETVNKGFWDIPLNVRFANTMRRFGSMDVQTVQFFRPSDEFLYPHNEQEYLMNFKNLHTANGLSALAPYGGIWQFAQIKNWDIDSLYDSLKAYGEDLSLAVVIFPRKDRETREKYANFKIVVDQRLGLKSICFNEKNMIGSLGKPTRHYIGSEALTKYMMNISMKLNLRCGNWNHTVQFTNINSTLESTMILGADVVHPPSGSVLGSPSIAAVVGSLDSKFAVFPGSMRLNESRQEWIDEMEAMCYERLRAWSEANGGDLPKNILYYRDGVSESYFATVRKHEVNAIKQAYERAYKEWKRKNVAMGLGRAAATARVTTVIVTKRHHTGFYPSTNRDIKDPKQIPTTSGNCKAGLVVDSGVTNPYYFDFFLQSHNVLLGTGSPAHYTVLENEMEMSPLRLQDFTFALCHAYGSGNNAVSYATPAYYADKLCERGRHYLQPFHDNMKACERKDQNGDLLSDAAVRQEAERIFYRHGKGRNPWHPAHDGKMFWV